MADKSREAVDYFFRILSDELLSLARVNVEFMSEAAKSERVRERQARRCESVRQFMRWLLAEAQQKGEVRDDVDIDAAAELMIALNEGILLLSVVGLRTVSLEALKPAYLSLLNAGLSSPASTMFAAAAEPAPAHLLLGEGGGLMDGRHRRRRGRVGVLAPVDGPGFQPHAWSPWLLTDI